MATVGGDYRGHRRLSVFRSARVNRVRAALPLLVLSGGERHESLYLAALLAGGRVRPRRPRASARTPLAARRRQGLQLSDRAPAFRAAAYRRDHPTPPRPAARRPASRTVRPARIPRAEPGGTTHQPTEAALPPCHPLRDTRRALPRDANPRGAPALARPRLTGSAGRSPCTVSP